MKNPLLLAASLFLTLSLFSSCEKGDFFSNLNNDSCISYKPIHKALSEIRQGLLVVGPQDLKNPGKLYYYQDYVLINEINEGVHIFDNSDPYNPQNTAFIQIPGNMDIAVKDDILYADNYIDLLAIDISNPKAASLICRSENVFSGFGQANDDEIVIGYEEIISSLDCGDLGMMGHSTLPTVQSGVPIYSAVGGSQTTSISGGTGTGGSMARFTIADDYLYTVDSTSLHSFNIANPCPQEMSEIFVSEEIETIFPHEGYLFIGDMDGMHIFNAVSNPNEPVFETTFTHSRSCDPVFIDGNYAYITLRDGTMCGSAENVLLVVDIGNISNPKTKKRYSMTHPHGLSVKDDILYLCDGRDGLKVYDASNKTAISSNQLYSDASFDAYDVIAAPDKNLVMLIGKDGFYQYDNTDPRNMLLMTHIPANISE